MPHLIIAIANRLLSGRLLFSHLLLGIVLLLQTTVAFSSLTVINQDVLKASSLYREGKVDEAIAIFTLSAYEGFATSQYNLAMIYFNREGEVNQKEFEFWLAMAAESGDVDAQFNLGMLFYQDEDQFGRLDKAVKWLDAAAQAGNVKAQYNLGYLSFSNLEVSVTKQQGIVWLQKSARAGDTHAISLIRQLQQNKIDNPPPLYEMFFEMKEGELSRQYVIKYDDAEVYALPVGQQTPVFSLAKDSVVQVLEVKEGWLGVKISDGFPAWVPESQLNIESGVAKVADMQAGLYVEPGYIQQSFKIGSVDQFAELPVIGYESGWIKVTAPDYFRLWIRETDIVEKYIEEAGVDPDVIDQSTEVASITAKIPIIPDKKDSGSSVESSPEKQPEPSPKKITLTRLHQVYENASRESRLLGIIRGGTEVAIQDVSGEFSRASWSGGVQAWVFGKFFNVSGDFGFVTTNNVRLRILPDTSSNATIIGRANKDERFEIAGSENGWYRIVVAPQSEGWIENP